MAGFSPATCARGASLKWCELFLRGEYELLQASNYYDWLG